MARGRGLALPTVFTLHSAFAGVCGALALLVPAFFGQVFPDLASPVGRPAHTRLARLAHALPAPRRLPCCPAARHRLAERAEAEWPLPPAANPNPNPTTLTQRRMQETLAFIVRVYAVLLSAQAPLLYGIRQVESGAANP